ncbi:MAG: hypothetical protein A3A28_03510 [Candidatus Sungbacteria bacterium RIFCSPLOWO2_01_FULL_47_32]|nr:MAG: hypothetical protein A3A28_03510 [Candidatus Sungbacteria bacterium RIFCSPLOWO2_01_FULL_47_32]
MLDETLLIKTLPDLYRALDQLYQGIEKDCAECQDPDCMGYVWLLKEEGDRLYEIGVPLVQINGGPTFIHSFPQNRDGSLNPSEKYPPCSQLCADSRRCSIYPDRPMVCRLYPLGFETGSDGTIHLALHLDCLHIRRLEERGALYDFERRALGLFNSISPGLLAEIADSYRKVDAISVFPDGENSYRNLKEVMNRVQVQGRPGQ